MAAFRTNSRAAILAVATIGLFLLGSSGAQAHEFTASSRIGIRFEDGKFKGRVRSERPRCIKRRDVKVFKVRQDRPDRLIGEDKTDDEGRYVIPKPAGVQGRFYAQVARRKTSAPEPYPHLHRCKAATSRIIRAP
jgi:hypothetical protein